MPPNRTRALVAALLLATATAAPTAAQLAPSDPEPQVQQGDEVAVPGVPAVDRRLSTALLSETDLPPGLRRQPRASGQVVVPGLSGYVVTFLLGDPDEAPNFLDLLTMPAGTIVLVKNSVQVLSPEALTPGVLDSVIMGAQAAASAGGALVDSTTDYSGLPVGEDSRGHSAHYTLPSLPSTSSTIIAFRRGDVIAALNVEAPGDDSLFDEALRLAQIVDSRLLALSAPAGPTPSAAAPPSSPALPAPPATRTATPAPAPSSTTPVVAPRP